MARSRQSSGKKEMEKSKKLKQDKKDEKREQRKLNSNKGKGFDSMIAYVDHNGQLTSTPPDPKLKKELKLEDIQLGAKIHDPNEEQESSQKSGRISYYNEQKGYGFIKDSHTKEQLFFHLSNVLSPVKLNDVVNYDVSRGPKGLVAVSVKKTSELA